MTPLIIFVMVDWARHFEASSQNRTSTVMVLETERLECESAGFAVRLRVFIRTDSVRSSGAVQAAFVIANHPIKPPHASDSRFRGPFLTPCRDHPVRACDPTPLIGTAVPNKRNAAASSAGNEHRAISHLWR